MMVAGREARAFGGNSGLHDNRAPDCYVNALLGTLVVWLIASGVVGACANQS